MSRNEILKMLAKDSLLSRYLQIFFVVIGYWIVSMLTVFVNKKLLSEINLEAPMFITFFQTVISILICFSMKSLSYVFPNALSFPETNPFELQTIKDVLPLSILFTSMIATNNLCLKHVSVAFYYIGRSLTTIFNVVFTYLLLGEKTSRGCIFCCFVIIAGFYMGVDQEHFAGSLSVKGTVFGVLGSLTLSLFSIFTKKTLPKVGQQLWLLSYYNNIFSAILFVPLIIANNELAELFKYPSFDIKFWSIMFLGGVCGFSVGWMTSMQIKFTSALTHNISGTAKACAQTVMATFIYNEVKSFLWWLSNFIVLFGSAGYARLKQMDMEKKHNETRGSREKLVV